MLDMIQPWIREYGTVLSFNFVRFPLRLQGHEEISLHWQFFVLMTEIDFAPLVKEHELSLCIAAHACALALTKNRMPAGF